MDCLTIELNMNYRHVLLSTNFLTCLRLYAIGCDISKGTPEYLAPEILENKGHGKAVDWWAMGTLLYEMLCGLPPFYDTNVQKMYQKIMNAPLKFPRPEVK